MRALVVLMLAGCVEDVPPPPVVPAPTTSRRPVDCSSLPPVIERIFSRSTNIEKKAVILDAVMQSCTEDRWSTDLIQCFIGASDDRHAQGCANLLTKEQMQSFQNRVISGMTRSAPPPPAPAPAP